LPNFSWISLIFFIYNIRDEVIDFVEIEKMGIKAMMLKTMMIDEEKRKKPVEELLQRI